MEEKELLNQVEAYCLGLLSEEDAAFITQAARKHSALRAAIEAKEQSLIQATSTPLNASLKYKILEQIKTIVLQETIDLLNLPIIHKNSDLEIWRNAVEGLSPDFEQDGLQGKILKDTPDHTLTLAWLSTSLEEEGHADDTFMESLFVLEGTCTCEVGNQTFYLKPGDFLDIPPSVQHNVICTSPTLGYVKGIIQRMRKAA